MTTNPNIPYAMPYAVEFNDSVCGTIEFISWMRDNLVGVHMRRTFYVSDRRKVVTEMCFSSENDAIAFKMRWR